MVGWMYRVGKNRLTFVSMQNTEFILEWLFINHCVIFCMNNYEPTFAPPCPVLGFGRAVRAADRCTAGTQQHMDGR